MIKLSILHALLFASCVFQPHASGAVQTSSPASETTTSIRKVILDLRSKYASTSGTGRLESLVIQKGVRTGGLMYEPFAFSRIPNMLRVDKLGSEMRRPNGEVIRAKRGAKVINDKSSFVVSRSDEKKSFLIESLHEVNERDRQYLTQAFCWCFDCPFSAGPMDLAAVIDKPDWSMSEPKTVDYDGRKLMRVQFAKSTRVEKSKKGDSYGWKRVYTAFMDPELDNVVCAYTAITTYTNRASDYFSGQVEYRKNAGGPAIPTKLTCDHYSGKEPGSKFRLADQTEISGIEVDVSTVYFDTFDFVPRPASDFETTAFNLPDLSKPGPSARSGIGAAWLFAGAGLSLFLAVGSSIYAARRRARHIRDATSAA